MDRLIADVRYALRKLASSPGFAALTVLTLALGIGANTAIFSVLNGVLLRPLPYPQPERLMFITSQFPSLGFDQFWVSAPEFLEFRDWNGSFESVGAYNVSAANLGVEQPVRPVTALVTSELMPTLGVRPRLGRWFTREDTLPNAEDVGILSFDLWQRSFNADPGVLGRLVKVNGTTTRIVGVMPPAYDVHDQKVELWLPLTLDPQSPGPRGRHFLYLIGRLKPGVTLAQARADLGQLLAGWEQRSRASHNPNTQGHRLRIDDLKEDVVGTVGTALWVLQAAVACVLLIACANLANLLLARADARHREFAVRSALGAGRGRLLRQFLTEGLAIAVLGGVLGIAVASLGLRVLFAAYPEGIPRSAEVSLDWRVLLFTVVIVILTGLIFGLAPLLHLREARLGGALKESGTRSSAGSVRTRTRSALVMGEVALAVVLVVGAGLLLRSFWNLMQVDAGFDRTRLTTFGLVLPDPTFPGPRAKVAAFGRLLERIEQIPGVQNTAAMSGLPPSRSVNANDTDFEGLTPQPGGPIHNVDYYNFVSARYVDTMKIPVLTGRGFQEADATGGPVALVNEALAGKFYPGIDPVGSRCCSRPWAPTAYWRTRSPKDARKSGSAWRWAPTAGESWDWCCGTACS